MSSIQSGSPPCTSIGEQCTTCTNRADQIQPADLQTATCSKTASTKATEVNLAEAALPNIPPTKLVQLQQARIRALLGEVTRLQQHLHERDIALQNVTEETAQLQKQQSHRTKSVQALETKVESLEMQNKELQKQVELKDGVIAELTKDGNRLDKERRKVEDEMASREARLQKALGEIQRYKVLLDEVQGKLAEREPVAVEVHAALKTEVIKLQRQKADALAAYRKAMRLVDVLRRQKVHLEAARVLQFTEQEFIKSVEGLALS